MLAILALLTLLPGYHRTYDRVIMLLIVPAALEMLELGPAWAAAMMALTGLWIDSDVLFLQVLRRFRETPVSPVLELALCILLLVSLLVQRKLARVAGQAPV